MSDDRELTLPDSPSNAVEAMRLVMKQAEEAALARQAAKKSRDHQAAVEVEKLEMLAEMAMIDEPYTHTPLVAPSFALGDALQIEELIEQAALDVPDPIGEDRDGDLVVMRHDAQPEAWYQLAAEAALPQALRGMVGPVDVKALLQALLVEIGDVKRTNAVLMEMITRLDEKVERTNRTLKDRKFHG